MPIQSNMISGIKSNTTSSSTGSISSAGNSSHAINNSLGVSNGQVITGTVSDVRGNQVTIVMEDGTSFTGQLAEASQYSIGQQASFQVISTSAKVIYMKALSEAFIQDMDETVYKALDEAGLPKSPHNTDIVESLLKNGQSISKQSIQDAIRLCAKYPNASVDTVITMNRLSLPMTQESVAQFEQYANQTHQLLAKSGLLGESIKDVLNLVGNQAPQAAKTIGSQILNLVLEPSILAPDESPTPVPGQIQTPSRTFPVELLPSNVQPLLDENGLPVPNTYLMDGETIISGEQLVENELLTPEAKKQLAAAANESQQASQAPVTFDRTQTGFVLLPEVRQNLAQTLSALPLPQEIKQGVLDGTISTENLLQQVKALLPDLTEEQAASILSDKGLQELVKAQFVNGLSISPRAVKDGDSINQLYFKMERQLAALDRMSESLTSQKVFQELSTTAHDMQDNLQFMKTMNQTFTYLQLPLKMTEHNAHGDLYVMTRKESLKKNPNNLSVLLHLDMDHLGTLDIHIKKENTSVSAKFYVADPSVQNLLSNNLELLKDAINQQGLTFTSECLMKEKEFDVVNDFIGQDKPVGTLTRYNFDLRA